MAPFPSSSPQAPTSPVVPPSAAQPAEPSLADLLRTSPALFWLLIGVFSIVMALGMTWVAVSWWRYVKRGGLDKGEKRQTRTGRGRWHWLWGSARVKDAGIRGRKEAPILVQLPKQGAEEEKACFGPFAAGWTPPVRSSSLVHLEYYANATFVPPHEHGLPLSDIQEESESDTSRGANDSFRSSRAYDDDKSELSVPSIVIDASTSSASLSSLAYLSTTSSPLTAFIESLDAFPRPPTTLPNLPSPYHLQVPSKARTRPSSRSVASPTGERKRRENPESTGTSMQSHRIVSEDNGYAKENIRPRLGEKLEKMRGSGALKETRSTSQHSPNPTDRQPLATVPPATTSTVTLSECYLR